MKLNKLFNHAPAITIEHLMTDSRLHRPKSIFYCLKGMVNDGHAFVEQAIENGAVVVVHSDPLPNLPKDVIGLQVSDVLHELNRSASIFFNHPSQKLKLFGVTGTNGKSTVAKMLRSILNPNVATGYSGTISIEYNDVVEQPSFTTPEPIELLEMLNRMRKAKIKAASLEVSSQALDQGRVDALLFDVAIFTNLTHDHLDYHGTFENYYQAKKHLFDLIKPEGQAIINLDDEYGRRLYEEHRHTKFSYSILKPADYYATNIRLSAQKSEFQLHVLNQVYEISTNVVSEFNISNLVAVVAALHAHGLSMDRILPFLNDLPQVEGRMEVISEGQDFNVIVDYAHTPDGFEKIYAFARSITPDSAKIISVFGAAGKRDVKKRPILGSISDRYCKNIILTEEDPRNESALEIAKDIAAGIKDNNYVIILDRADAIRQAIEMANKHDTVLILAKGNETYLAKAFGKEAWPGDPVVAKDVLNALMRNEGEHDEPHH